jgi:hypothetical protein
LGSLFMREIELVEQAAHAVSLFQRIQVFTLDILNERHDGGVFVSNLAHQHRHFCQAGQLCRAETPFASNNFILSGALSSQRAHQNRLHDPLSANRLRQLTQGAFIHAGTRLVFAGLKHGHFKRRRGLDIVLTLAQSVDDFCILAKQGVQPTAQAFWFSRCHVVFL